MRPFSVILFSSAVILTALPVQSLVAQKKPAAKPAPKPAVAPRPPAAPQPKARYAMDVGTTTGLAGMAGGGFGSAMSMMFGGSGKEARELHLRLGSTLAATGDPKADHFFLPAAKLGKSVPLLTPQQVEGTEQPRDFQRPKGRLLIYWGCGTHAPKGQPVIIDFSKIAAGQMPPNLYTARIPPDRGPSVTSSRTYGEWPNAKSTKQPGSGSILGEHRIASTYAPEIRFALAQDYMAGLRGQSSPGPEGSVALSWNSVPAATGYYAWIMGFAGAPGRDGPQDLVWWSSSAGREFGGGLWDWLSPDTVARLVADRTVMPPSQTNCTVPAEVKAAAPDFMMGTLFAYGPEANFSYPPRPATGPWIPEWTARVRYRSSTMWMIGGPMADAGQAQGKDGKKKCKPSLFGAVTGLGC